MFIMLGPFDPIAISAGLLTNLAYDIIKNKSQSSNNTLVGRMLQWIGFKEASFDERLQDTLTKTLSLYLKMYPQNDLKSLWIFSVMPGSANK